MRNEMPKEGEHRIRRFGTGQEIGSFCSYPPLILLSIFMEKEQRRWTWRLTVRLMRRSTIFSQPVVLTGRLSGTILQQ
ncbi:unnamed protein product [Strongylus vulgaris]|uniref:Uncharacterized protein n=1 Tax=Strongylus vulgaris TaxID=40348 RepID=A0A3P7I915_STRVU|nr:unnamed protein product [Strongylus vulgaris]